MERDYTVLSPPELLQELGDSAPRWATAFMQIVIDGKKEIDWGLMNSWFANAIEHSSDIRKKAMA